MKTAKITTIIQVGLLILVALMPFHAFFSVWLGSLTHHEAIIQSWKEVSLAVLAALSIILVWREPARLRRLKQPWVLAVAAFTTIALLVTLVARPSFIATIFGLKTDLEFLLAAVIATLVTTPRFLRQLTFTVLVGAAIVSAYDVLQIFVLPADFLTHFGYGPNTVAPYQTITEGTSALRFPGTLGGPNQLGTYLILPLSLSLLFVKRRPIWLVLSVTTIIALTATYSRAAWLGAIVAVCFTAFYLVPNKWRRLLGTSLAIAALAAVLVLPLAASQNSPLQYFLLHSSVAAHDQADRSDSQHLSSLKTGIREDLKAPLGHGLGAAGPTAFHTGEGYIIENYFLQIGYETGIAGLLAFLVILVLLIRALAQHVAQEPLATASIAALLGVSVAALVLPAWTDSSTALITWICAGAAITTGEHNV